MTLRTSIRRRRVAIAVAALATLLVAIAVAAIASLVVAIWPHPQRWTDDDAACFDVTLDYGGPPHYAGPELTRGPLEVESVSTNDDGELTVTLAHPDELDPFVFPERRLNAIAHPC